MLTHMISGMRHTNSLRHDFLQGELDLTATVAIVDQTTVETVQTVISAKFHTDVADEQLDLKVSNNQHNNKYCI